jgi:secreted trypsin-like serine protease
VNLPVQGERVLAGADAVLSGWGYTVQGVVSPDELQMIEMTILSDFDCQTRFEDAFGAYPDIDNDSMICAYIEGGSGCQGDSGGPLTCGSDDALLCGVVSWGSSSCSTTSGTATVFAEVANYVSWLNDEASGS